MKPDSVFFLLSVLSFRALATFGPFGVGDAGGGQIGAGDGGVLGGGGGGGGGLGGGGDGLGGGGGGLGGGGDVGGGQGGSSGGLCATVLDIDNDDQCWKHCDRAIHQATFCMLDNSCDCNSLLMNQDGMRDGMGNCQACYNAVKKGLQLNLEGSQYEDHDIFGKIVEDTFGPMAASCGMDTSCPNVQYSTYENPVTTDIPAVDPTETVAATETVPVQETETIDTSPSVRPAATHSHNMVKTVTAPVTKKLTRQAVKTVYKTHAGATKQTKRVVTVHKTAPGKVITLTRTGDRVVKTYTVAPKTTHFITRI
uniref:ARAD1C17710p n=1 Tax=Blastobotrys adeninivorans TaxID=409370 RepID=A0A060T155_BLAAD